MFFRRILIFIVAAQVLVLTSGCEQIKDFRKKAYYEKALKSYELGRYNRAIEESTFALVFDGEFADAVFLIAKCQYALKDYETAADSFRRVFYTDRTRIDSMVRALQAYMLGGAFAKATAYSHRMLKLYPDNVHFLYAKACAGIRSRRLRLWGHADTILQPLLNNEEYSERAYALLAEFHILNNELEDADRILAEHTDANDDWFVSMRVLAGKYGSLGDLEGAVRLYKRMLEINPKSTRDIDSLLELLRKTGKKEEEQQFIEMLIASNGQEIRYKFQLVDFFIYYNQFVEAEQHARACIQQGEGFFDFSQRLIDIYERTQRYDKGISIAKDVLRQIEEDVEQEVRFLGVLAWLYYLNGKPEIAKFVVRWTLELDSDDSSARFLLARISLDEGRTLLAIAELRRLSVEDVDNPDYDYYTGLAHVQRSEYGAAEQSFKLALSKDPAYKGALLNITKIYFEKGLFLDVEDMIAEYLAISPNDPEILALQADLAEKLVVESDEN